MHVLSEADQIKGIAYAHELLAQTLGLSNRRDTFIPPHYIADMSILNAQLDALSRD